MKKVNVFAVFMMISIVSFLGFVLENVWIYFSKGYIDNRNMILPFIFGYGLTIAAIFLVFGTPDNMRIFSYSLDINNKKTSYSLYFMVVMIIISIGEIIIGKFIEKTCHLYWWDYSRLPLHITRYTSVITSVVLSLFIMLFINKMFIPIYNWLLTRNKILLMLLSTVLIVLMILDISHTFYYMYNNNELLIIWRIPNKL